MKKKWQIENQEIEDEYIAIEIVGKGTYATVYKAYKKSNPDKIYAVKKMDISKEKDGFPMTSLREISILKKLDHENIVKCIEIKTSKRHLISVRTQQLQKIHFLRNEIHGT